MSHIYISAAHKSSGKTMISTGLARAFAARGMIVQPFKKGPDYIDPKWLSDAAGRACLNLDFHTQSEDEIKAMFAKFSLAADISLIEGNKGLYDGVNVDGTNSNAALAKMLRAPVILVVDTVGITRGIAPLLIGYQVFDPEVNIAGVILNKVRDPRHEDKLVKAIEHYTDIPVLGAVRRNAHLNINERHIGLIPSNEYPAAHAHIETLAEHVSQHVDLNRIQAIADRADRADIAPPPTPLPIVVTHPDVRIAVARDAAFGFYYADDLNALKHAGAQLVYFNALNDVALPTCDGLFLGGGFPETQMAKLQANTPLRSHIKATIEAGLPAYAECGGLMYLCRSITWHENRFDMVGVIGADALMHSHPQGRGYSTLKPTAALPWPGFMSEDGADIPAHEFHYSSLENADADFTYAFQILRGKGITGTQDGIVMHNLVAGFTHLRDTSRCRWAEPFTAFVRAQKAARGGTSSPVHIAGS